MLRHNSRFVFLIVSLCICGLARNALAARPAAKRIGNEEAAEFVQEALQAEAVGNLIARRELLENTAESSGFAPAKWQMGKIVQENGAWGSVADSVERASRDRLLKKYREQRAKLAGNAHSHLAIARWCMEKRLPLQARAHLSRVIDLDPNNATARAALGFRRMGSEWLDASEIAKIAHRAKWSQASVRTYRRQLEKIKQGMTSRHERIRKNALAELNSITDADAVAAVEFVFSTPHEELSNAAIEWLSQIDSVEASKSLSRFSLMHPSEGVRQLATSRLSQRPLHDFVPDLLGMLESPVSTMVVPSFDQSGRLTGYRQAFHKENFEDQDLVMVNHRIETMTVGTNDPSVINVTAEQQRADAVQKAVDGIRERTMGMQRENAQRAARNARIAKVIASASNEPYTDDSEKMWTWWDEYNETDYQSDKPKRYASYNETQYVVLSGSGPSRMPTITRTRSECFVAGTPVMTQLGLKPIESIMAGDTVLSRNIATSELTWKPVLLATQRPPTTTTIVSVSGESFTCTDGHLFWVSGTGWVKASDLRVGDVLHAAEEPAIVLDVQAAERAATFNLRVADHSNYFVGEKMLLSHDVTARGTNHHRVPGLSLASDAPKK